MARLTMKYVNGVRKFLNWGGHLRMTRHTKTLQGTVTTAKSADIAAVKEDNEVGGGTVIHLSWPSVANMVDELFKSFKLKLHNFLSY